MTWSGWNNGKKSATGAGYGFKVTAADRNRSFKREWLRIGIELPTPLASVTVEVNIDKDSFWGDCRELISKDIGRWMLDHGYAPWPKRRPPKFDVAPSAERTFHVEGCIDELHRNAATC